jgi:PadR family transcriptional regulator AphA
MGAAITPTEFAILALLTWGPSSGYDLRKAVKGSVGYMWAPAKTQIYTVLPRLERAGFVRRRQVAQSGRPDKSVYSITRRGEAAVRAWLADPAAGADDERSTFLLKVFFGHLADPGVLLEQIRARRAEMETLRAELEEIDSRYAGSSGDEFPALTRRYGIDYATMVIAWAEAAERELTRTLATVAPA